MMPEKISLMASFLRDKEPLMYLFLLNATYKKIEDNSFTAGVSLKNGITFYYSDALLQRPVEEFYFILVHEAQHIFKQHLHIYSDIFSDKGEKQDALLMNIATDAIINWEISKNDFEYFKELSLKEVKVPDAIEVEYEFLSMLNRNNIAEEDGLTSLRYYNWLKENGLQAEVFEKEGEALVGIFHEGMEGTGSYKSIYKIFEDYNKSKDEGEEDSENEDSGKNEEETKNMISRLMKQAVKMEEKLAGKETGSMASKFTTIKKSEINWKRELRKRIKYFISKNVSTPKKRKSYLTYLLNPKSGKDLIFPHYLKQRDKTEANIIIAMDTSGSCFFNESEMSDFFAEIDSIASMLDKSKRGKIHLIQWDYRVKNEPTVYSPGDYKTLEVKGGGGTDPNSVLDYLLEKSEIKDNGNIKIKAGSIDIFAESYKKLPLIIFITDGYFFRNFRQEGLYEKNNNLLFFTRSEDYIPQHLDRITYK